jgi:hypothetical protein
MHNSQLLALVTRLTALEERVAAIDGKGPPKIAPPPPPTPLPAPDNHGTVVQMKNAGVPDALMAGSERHGGVTTLEDAKRTFGVQPGSVVTDMQTIRKTKQP